MSEFTIHSIAGSPYGRAVLAILEEKRLPYRFSPVTPGSLGTSGHLARHPFGKVPVLEHDGFSLYETQAILRYLDRICPSPCFTPIDLKAAARMDQAMNVNDCYLFPGPAKICFQRVVGPRLLGMTADEAIIDAMMPQALFVFKKLAQMLGEQHYFAGNSVSLADLLIGPQVDFFAATPEWNLLGAPYPNLVAWLARLEARPSMKATTWERVARMAEAAA